jgi:drug/metabolite transporter, DME family
MVPPVTVARLQIIAAAILFSTGGAAIKATSFDGLGGGLTVACFRSLIAAVALALFLPRARRGWSWRTWVVGGVFAVTLILFVVGNKLTTSANTIFLQSTAPFWIALTAPFLLHERVRRTDLMFMGVMVAAMALVFLDAPAPVETAPQPLLGNILSVLSGVGWAGSLMGLRWLGKYEGTDSAAAATVAGNLVAFVVCLPFALGPAMDSTGGDWLLLIFLGVVQIGLAYVCVTAAVRHLPAFEVGLLLYVEPALNPVWTWMVHGETVGGLTILGGVVILAATAVKTYIDTRGSPLPEPG